MATKIAKVQTEDRALNDVQDNISRALSPLLSNPLLFGVLLSGVSLKSGSNTIDHKLGRVLQGWVITRQRAQVQVWDTQDSNKTPSINLTLSASAPVTVDLYVF